MPALANHFHFALSHANEGQPEQAQNPHRRRRGVSDCGANQIARWLLLCAI